MAGVSGVASGVFKHPDTRQTNPTQTAAIGQTHKASPHAKNQNQDSLKAQISCPTPASHQSITKHSGEVIPHYSWTQTDSD
ncbi:MAG: hypothetical protein HC852_09915 [Acaryochloridaceae cyanobacterium RU_4_10]|nr:hypothetical protein [Acaryochloridaceae cyanobacterium RU_4_10]